MKPSVRIRLNAAGIQWFNPSNRKWVPLDEMAHANVVTMLEALYAV